MNDLRIVWMRPGPLTMVTCARAIEINRAPFGGQWSFRRLPPVGARGHLLPVAEYARSDYPVDPRIEKQLRLAAASGQSDRRLPANVVDPPLAADPGDVAIARNTAASADGGAAAPAAHRTSNIRPFIAYVIFASGLKYVGLSTTALGRMLAAVLVAAGAVWLAFSLRDRARSSEPLTRRDRNRIPT